MNFTILGPNDNQLKDSKSDMTASNFGGNREVTQNISKSSDYTKQGGGAPNQKVCNSDTAEKDIDEMEIIKYQCTFQKADFITKSDPENRPISDEGSDAVKVPDDGIKRHRKPNQWQFGTESVDESEIS